MLFDGRRRMLAFCIFIVRQKWPAFCVLMVFIVWWNSKNKSSCILLTVWVNYLRLSTKKIINRHGKTWDLCLFKWTQQTKGTYEMALFSMVLSQLSAHGWWRTNYNITILSTQTSALLIFRWGLRQKCCVHTCLRPKFWCPFNFHFHLTTLTGLINCEITRYMLRSPPSLLASDTFQRTLFSNAWNLCCGSGHENC